MPEEAQDNGGSFMRRTRNTVEKYGYVFAVLCILVSTLVFIPGREYFAKGQWALLYLLIIGGVAGVSGVRPAVLAAILAFLTWNYFLLPPYHTFLIADSKDWIALLAFLAVGVAMGVQTGRMREREAEALSREREMELLNHFSAQLVSDRPIAEMGDALLVELGRITGATCAVIMLPDDSDKLYPVEASLSGCSPDDTALALAEWVHREAKAVGLPAPGAASETPDRWPVTVIHEYTGVAEQRGDICLPMLSTTRQEGALYIGPRPDGAPYAIHDARLLVAASNLVAAFLERKRLQSMASKADALREADRLKSTLVSSVSHELKTPLAAMTATVSNMLEEDVEWDEANVREELQSLQNNLDRLNTSIGSLVDLSRLESAAWEPKKEPCELGDILSAVLSKLPSKEKPRVSFAVPDDLPFVLVDYQQMARALGNILENALAYSGPDAPVRVAVSAEENDIRLSVEDSGPGVPAEDRERIFEKFYRGAASAKSPSGTGLGLAIAREIVRFHGGKIWVEDAHPHGARFVVSLPRETNPNPPHPSLLPPGEKG